MDEMPSGKDVAGAGVVRQPQPDSLSPPRWRVLVAVVLSTMGLGGAGIVYTNWAVGEQRKAERRAEAELLRAEREADRRWCELLITLDDAYGATPPQSSTGQRLAADVHNLRVDLGC